MARVYKVAPLNMEWCLDCHRRAAALEKVSIAPDLAPGTGSPTPPLHYSSLLGDPSLMSALETAKPSHAITHLTTCSACHR